MGKHILITGALGNLGLKLIRHLAPRSEVSQITGIDLVSGPARMAEDLRQELEEVNPGTQVAKLNFLVGDLRVWQDNIWHRVVEGCDALVHFAAQVPEPQANWDDAAASLDMNLHIGLAAVAAPRCRRVVFATTNHVMGKYKDEPLASTVGPGELNPDSPLGVGTVVNIGDIFMDSTPYAAAKFAGERLYRALAHADRGKGDTEFVTVRIGWCNSGDNHPSSLTATGSPIVPEVSAASAERDVLTRADHWFKEMWLSNRDFVRLFEKALLSSSASWPGPMICVNGMSRNQKMKWNLEETRRLLGYEPQDDVREHISLAD